jgi:hypothetical protein
MVDSGKLPNGY